MEKAGKFQGSHGKRKNKEKSEEEVSDTLENSVNKSKNVNKMLTNQRNKNKAQSEAKRRFFQRLVKDLGIKTAEDMKKMRFSSLHQRVNYDTLLELNKVAYRYNRRSFNDTLNMLIECYNFLEAIARRYGLADIRSAMKYIDKNLPKDNLSLIIEKVQILLEDLGINDTDGPILEQEFVSILANVKLRNKSAREVLEPLLLVAQNSTEE